MVGPSLRWLMAINQRWEWRLDAPLILRSVRFLV